jgi:uncharacterized membrane protein
MPSPARCPLCQEQHATHQPIPREGGWMERTSDFLGSTPGILALAAVEAAYIATAGIWLHLDPYPFGFLTLVLSLIALTFTQIVMIVQNRQGAILEAKATTERANVADDLATDRAALDHLAAIRAHLGC